VPVGELARVTSSAPVISSAEASAPYNLAPSITTHLQMQLGQIEQLNRLYDGYTARRLKQEAGLMKLQNQMQQAQAPTTFDQNKATRLLREINEAQQKVASDLLATRANAIKILTPVQRLQLESLATDARIRVPGDRYYQLLLMPVEALWQVPLDNGWQPGQPQSHADQYPGNRRTRDNGSGSYGVYGGYSYGYPDYGVYGNYGQGGVGVQVGIGRGGPSIGVGIGRVFGGIFGGRHRRH
jgi:Spy/CpxP family protein refolding chaperone